MDWTVNIIIIFCTQTDQVSNQTPDQVTNQWTGPPILLLFSVPKLNQASEQFSNQASNQFSNQWSEQASNQFSNQWSEQ